MARIEKIRTRGDSPASTADIPEMVWSAKEILSWSYSAIQPGLRSAVAALSPPLRRIASYHFGWTDEHGRPIQASSGKAVRPALTLLTAHAAGGSTAVAVPAAIAIELVHNFSLLHDDVMDGDTTRRHRPAAWTVFGTSETILAGDALLALALGTIAGSGHLEAARHTQLISTAVMDLTSGQCADLAFEHRDTVAIDDYLEMVAGKTAALIACACALGAMAAGATPEQVEHLRHFGGHLGTAFQCVDDILGIWGDPSVTGKPAHSDLRSRKKTLPVLSALNSGTPAAAELTALLKCTGALSHANVQRAAHLVDVAGGRAQCQSCADKHVKYALQYLRQAVPTPRAGGLETLASLIVHRDH